MLSDAEGSHGARIEMETPCLAVLDGPYLRGTRLITRARLGPERRTRNVKLARAAQPWKGSL